MNRLIITCVVAGTLALPTISASQEPQWIPGLDRLVKSQDTVRIWTHGRSDALRGAVKRVVTDSLWIDNDKLFARGSMMRMDVQTGRHASTARALASTALGFVGGALVMGSVGYYIGSKSCNAECQQAGNAGIGQGIGAFVFGAGGGLLGGVTGLILGSREYRQWKQVFP